MPPANTAVPLSVYQAPKTPFLFALQFLEDTKDFKETQKRTKQYRELKEYQSMRKDYVYLGQAMARMM